MKHYDSGEGSSLIAVAVNRAVNSIFFPIVTAAVVLLSYYLGLDVYLFWYYAVCGLLIFVFCKDVTPFFSLAVFFNLSISYKNSPSTDIPAALRSDYYFRTGNVVQIGIAIGILVAAAVVRLIVQIVRRKFKLTPMFWGLSVFCVALLFNGLGAEQYKIMDFVYGLILAALFMLVFVFCCNNVSASPESFKKLAYYLMVMCVVIAVEILVKYCTEEIIVNGKIERGRLFFGWGTYNNLGVLLTMALPAWFFFAGASRYGWAFLLGALVNIAAIIFCMSRQAMMMGALILIVCCVWTVIKSKGKYRIINICVMAFIAIAAGVLFGVFYDKIIELFGKLSLNFIDGSGRNILWKKGFENFKSRPIAGVGFFVQGLELDRVASGLPIIPPMCHNTVVELMGACGVLGLATYIAHRVNTVICFFRNITHERVFVALGICGLLLTSLLDNHIFYIFPTVLYSFMLGYLSVTANKYAAAERQAAEETRIAEEEAKAAE